MAAEFRALPELEIADYDELLQLGPESLRHGVLDNGLRLGRVHGVSDLATTATKLLIVQILCQNMCQTPQESCISSSCAHWFSCGA